MQICCKSRLQAAEEAHLDCFRSFPSDARFQVIAVSVALRISGCVALRKGHEKFAKRLLHESVLVANQFAIRCVFMEASGGHNSCKGAQWLQCAITASPEMDRPSLYPLTIAHRSPQCLSVVLRSGAAWNPRHLLIAAQFNHLDVLQILISHNIGQWSPQLPGQASCAGNVRFLNLIFGAGCQLWNLAIDGEPVAGAVGSYIPVGQLAPEDLPDWGLVVSSDLVCSGPVLLYAAEQGVNLTPRMRDMLVEVRRRALALAGCFHRAKRLSQASGAPAQAWQSMGAVPTAVVQSIATLARISLAAGDLVD